MLDWNDEFEWDARNEDKIAEKHCVDRYEAEGAARDPEALYKKVGKDRFGNPRYVCVGKTQEGRILMLVIDKKGSQHYRVGTARDADPDEKRSYRKRNR